jgi:SPP1 gp7 family putative phage head morphogenesis protein
MALIKLDFDKFIECENSWKLKPLYMETSESFRLFMLMEAQVFSTEITFEEVRSRFGNSPMVIELFRSTYIRDAIKINSIDTESSSISKDIKVDASELKTVLDGFLNDFKKFTLTSTGGQGTAGYAMIPVRLGSGRIRRCESCGQILLSGETSCPACGSENITDKDVEMEMKKWVGWDFEGTVKWILMFLEKYTMSQITDVTNEQKLSIKDALIHSITEGWTLNKLENTIATVVNDEDRARMIARTEVIRCANEGALLHYEEGNIEKVRWIATPSAPGGRTCDRCLALNGKEFLLKDAKGKIPLHVYCRCSFLPVVEK